MGDRRPRRDRAALASAPEAVSYLAMSLRVRPSLEAAVAFAADHAGPPYAAGLRDALWQVQLRGRSRIEEAVTALADAWGAWNEDAKRALYAIVHGVREGSPDGLSRSLDRARSIVFEGTRRRIRAFAAGLRGPTTALFALGVLLPLILGSMLPLLSIGTFAPSALEVVDPPPANPLWIVLLDVAFPAATYAFARRVASRGPRAGRPSPEGTASFRPFAALAAPLAAVSVLLLDHPLAAVLAILAGVAALSAILLWISRPGERIRRRTEAIERAFPDALFQLGSRLEEGAGLEDAMLAVANGTTASPVGDLFARTARSLRLGGGTVEAVLFGPGGALEDVPSPAVRGGFRTVVEIAAKDPAVAGRTALEVSGFLQEMHGIEDDVRAELGPTVEAMRATAVLFAPVVLGVTVAMYALLAEAFGGMANLPLTPDAFRVVLAVYVLLTAAAITDFVVRLEGGGLSRTCAALGRTLPVALLVFLASAGLAGLAL